MVVSGQGGLVALDTLTVTPLSAASPAIQPDITTYPAPGGAMTGTATVNTTYSQAPGGFVTGISDGPANSLTFTVHAKSAGTYAMTVRYANNQFWQLTIPVTLRGGVNTIKFIANPQYNWDSTTIGYIYSGSDIGQPLRSDTAPDIAQISIAPFQLEPVISGV